MRKYCIETDDDTLAFNEFEDATEYAEKNGYKTIYSGYDEYEKCEFCGEWYDTSEMNIEGYCERCQIAISDHGFTVDPRRKNDPRY